MKKALNLAGSVLGIAALVILAAALLLTIGGLGERPVAQESGGVDTPSGSSQPPPDTPTVAPYPPPQTPTVVPSATPTPGPYPPPPTPTVALPATPTAVPTLIVTPPVPVPTLVPIPIPPAILEGEKIAFLRDKNLQIINVASRALAPATGSGNVANSYGWSHDGSQLLLGVGERPVLPETDMPGGTDLWVLDIRGGRATQLTEGLEVRNASWSPVNNQIAYITRDGNLYVVASDGTERKQLLTQVAVDGLAWSPDGAELAYVQLEDPTDWGTKDIAVTRMSDSSMRQLTSDALENFRPVWSLDGTKILFESTRPSPPETGVWYIMSVDGGELRHLEESPPLVATNVERSPSTDQIAYQQSGYIWVMNVQGNAQRIIEGSDPSWSPDGSKLAYVGEDSGLWILNVDGTGPEKLSDAGSQPHWSD